MAILTGDVNLDYEAESRPGNIKEDEDDAKDAEADAEAMIDMDEIRTLVSSDSPADLTVLEARLQIECICEDPFDVETLAMSPQLLCILLQPANFRCSHEDDTEVTQPLNLFGCIGRVHDLLRLTQLLRHYQRTSACT